MIHSFREKLQTVQSDRRSALCVGLDPDLDRIPPHLLEATSPAEAVLSFNAAIIEATQASACAFKLNLAFYEVLGPDGWDVLLATCRMISTGTIIIADAKRGDIGNSARFYARAVFERLNVDACTVAPYMGRDSVDPFLQFPGKAAFVLCRTSNPGSKDFQERDAEGEKLYMSVARKVTKWVAEAPGEGGLVVGATNETALATIREDCPTLPFLIPGVGAQGGDAAAVIRAAGTETGPVIVNSSRKILYAASGYDFADAASKEAENLRITLESGLRKVF